MLQNNNHVFFETHHKQKNCAKKLITAKLKKDKMHAQMVNHLTTDNGLGLVNFSDLAIHPY